MICARKRLTVAVPTEFPKVFGKAALCELLKVALQNETDGTLTKKDLRPLKIFNYLGNEADRKEYARLKKDFERKQGEDLIGHFNSKRKTNPGALLLVAGEGLTQLEEKKAAVQAKRNEGAKSLFERTCGARTERGGRMICGWETLFLREEQPSLCL